MVNELTTKIALNGLHYSGASAAFARKFQGLGSILMFHRIGEINAEFAPNRHLSVTAKFLETTVSHLLNSGMSFVSMDEAARRIKTPSPKKSKPFVCITLDDGYRDNLHLAAPIFKKYQIPYTIYVAPGLVDGRATLWWEDLEKLIRQEREIECNIAGQSTKFDLVTLESKHAAFSKLLGYFSSTLSEQEQRIQMAAICAKYNVDCEAHRAASIMTWQELRQIATDPLCTIGAHTIHHYAVGRLEAKEAKHEMSESRRQIEEKLGNTPRHFAYPYGFPAAAGVRDFQIAKVLGFETAVTTRHGVCQKAHKDHMHALPRISMNGNFQTHRHTKTLLSGIPTRLYNRGAPINVD